MIQRIYRISGRVQGVGFRHFVWQRGRALKVRGYVTNLSDGRVEAVACGDAELLERFEKILHQGPPLSQVESVESQELSAANAAGSADFSDFTIRH